MPNRIIQVDAEEPAGQQVVVELVEQHPLTANAVDHQQQKRQQQLLRGDRRATTLWVELAEGGVEAIEGLISQPPHLMQRMGCRDARLRIDVQEQGTDAFLLAANTLIAVGPISRSWVGISADS